MKAGRLLSACLIATLGSCNTTATSKAKAPPATPGDRVVVVINNKSPDSERVGQYYMTMRGISPAHVVRVDLPVNDEIGEGDFRDLLAKPVQKAIDALPVRIDFIVLTKGVPLRIGGKRGYSVDAHLSAMKLSIPPMVSLDTAWLNRYRNPYWGSHDPFNSEKFGIYLVTRLDCGVVSDCLALVDRSLAARPVSGPFFFDAALASKDVGYNRMNGLLFATAKRLAFNGAKVEIDSSEKFVVPSEPVMGYVSWGSNDTHFDSAAYHAVRFYPGALAETFVSTSARTFGPAVGGQSRIVDLISQGVTGVKGYVSEPYTIALADPEILFDRYLRGFTLAESFYSASRMVLWKDVVIGDPLCAPYAGSR